MTRKNELSLLAKSGASLIAIVVACGSSAAAAQTAAVTGNATQGTAPAPSGNPVDDSAAATDNTGQEIVVVGSRASQRSAIGRKKNAATAVDSLVADDVGSFPDRNINEALSRVPGVALGRNDFGEGESVAIRGNGPDLTRVELDGLGVQATNSLAITAEGGRSADMRELPAALIKSVDVVKGSTADMTEGGLGGTILIKTRSGLDFKRPYLSIDVGAQQNSVGRKTTPQATAVAATKLLNDRLGLIASATYNRIQTNAHIMETTTSNNRGYARLFDFDQSPEKTFTFNPATVLGDLADDVFANSTETPLSLVTKSAGAQTKAECFTLFPHNGAGSTAQKNQRILEQQTCLNQWNDYTPSLIRSFMNSQEDKRLSLDFRADYQLTDDLVVYGKINQSNRKTDDQNRGRNLANGLIQQNIAGMSTVVGTGTTAPGYPRRRVVSPLGITEGYYLYDPQFGLTSQDNNAVLGNVLNVVPGSVTVDANHNVTQMTLTNNVTNIDQISNVNDTKTRYMQVGADFNRDRIEINAMAGMSSAKSTRADMRTSRQYEYGDATLTLQPNGLWGFDLPDGYDETNPRNFVQPTAARCLRTGTPPTCFATDAAAASPTNPTADPALTVGQIPLTTPSFSASWSPAIGESAEKIAKLDFAYRTDEILPFFTRFKTGVMFRNQQVDRWGNGGYTVQRQQGIFGTTTGPNTYVPAVVVPRAIGRGSYRACLPTATSTVPCNYGFVQSENPTTSREGVDTFTPEQLEQLFRSTLEPNTDTFFGDYPDRGDLETAWQGIRTRDLFQQLGAYQFMNFDCVKRCEGSDGQMYDQPVTRTDETIKNIYFMTDFEQDLPMNLRFAGNVGVRGVQTKVNGSGLLTLNFTLLTPAFNPANPTAAAGIYSVNFSRNATFKASTTDWLPTFNTVLWGFNDKAALRFYGGKTVARPRIDWLLPTGNCTIDQRTVFFEGDDAPMGCARIGNPALKPYTAWNYNLSAEWYPNRDTVLSIAHHRLNVTRGGAIGVTKDFNPFAGTEAGDEIDPTTGEPISAAMFNVPTWENSPGYKTRGLELQFKTALTFLPWILRHTGFDANISMLKSPGSNVLDPQTGDLMQPPEVSKRYTNLSVWYDDGRLQLRVAYQNRTDRFRCITPCGGNTTDINYPGEGYTNVRLVGPGYNPGVPLFLDGAKFIDAKASFNLTRYLQLYAEARNLTRTAQTVSTGTYVPFEDESIPRLTKISYGGRRIMGGVRLQFGGNR